MIGFTPLQKDHFPLIRTWLNSPHLKTNWGEDRIWTASEIEQKYSSYIQNYKIENGQKKTIYSFIIEYDQELIGYIQYYNAFDFAREGYQFKDVYNGPLSIAALDVYIGDPQYLGKGIGPCVIRQFLEQHIFKHFPACMVDPEKENKRAIRAYEKAGFKLHKELGSVYIMLATCSS